MADVQDLQECRIALVLVTEEDWVVLSEMTCLGLTTVGEDEGDGE